ncbi:hypothetical protein LEMLEM_LOCUS22251, partial [Lemmus lemmus]
MIKKFLNSELEFSLLEAMMFFWSPRTGQESDKAVTIACDLLCADIPPTSQVSCLSLHYEPHIMITLPDSLQSHTLNHYPDPILSLQL